MTFTISIRELVASLLVLPPSVETSATFILLNLNKEKYLLEWRWLSFQLDLQRYVYYFCSIWSKTKRGSMMRVEVGRSGRIRSFLLFRKNKETKILFDCGINRSYEDSYPKIERKLYRFRCSIFITYS